MNLRTWVESSPLSVSQIAELLGVHRVTLHHWMAGRIMPRPAALATICAVTSGSVCAADMAAGYAGRSEVDHTSADKAV